MSRFYEEILNKGDLAVADEIYAADYVVHGAPPGTPPGPEAVKQSVTRIRTAFPDFHITIDDMIAEGDKVVVRRTLRGTHQGEFNDMPPTGKKVTSTSMYIHRIADGKFAETWVEAGAHMGLLQQLGAVPAPGQSAS